MDNTEYNEDLVVSFIDFDPTNSYKITPGNMIRYDAVRDAQVDLHHKIKDPNNLYAKESHIAKCPGLNMFRTGGWVVPARYDLNINHHTVETKGFTDTWKKYQPNWKTKKLIKIISGFCVTIPEDQSLIVSASPFINTDSWFACSGIIPGGWGIQQLNVFLFVDDGFQIPAGTPLCAVNIIENSRQTAVFRDVKSEDIINNDYKTKLLDKSSLKDRNYRKLLKDVPWL